MEPLSNTRFFLYKEDFEKFSEGLADVVEYIKSNQEVVEKRYDPNAEHNQHNNLNDNVPSLESDSKDEFSF